MGKFLIILNNCKSVVIVLIAAFFGLLIPEIGSHLQPLITPIVIFLVFSSIVDNGSDSSSFDTYWKLLIIFLLLSYGLIPLIGIVIINFILSDGAKIGFGIMLAAPATAGSAIVWTRLSKGDVKFATIASLLSLFFAPLFTPQLLDYLITDSASVPTLSILTDLAIILAGGALMYVIFPKNSISAKKINFVTPSAIMLLIYISVSSSNLSYISPSWIILVIMSSFLLSILVFSLVFAIKYVVGISSSEAVSLYHVTALKNLGISVLISVSYTDTLVLTTVILYYVMQQLISAILSEILS